jgi:hypothetical protein
VLLERVGRKPLDRGRPGSRRSSRSSSQNVVAVDSEPREGASNACGEGNRATTELTAESECNRRWLRRCETVPPQTARARGR